MQNQKKGLVFRLKDGSLLNIDWPKRSAEVTGKDIVTFSFLDKWLPIVLDMSKEGNKKLKGKIDLVDEGYKTLFLLEDAIVRLTFFISIFAIPFIFIINFIYAFLLTFVVKWLSRFLEVYLTKDQSKRLSAVAVIIGMLLDGIFLPYTIQLHSVVILLQYLFIACVILLLMLRHNDKTKAMPVLPKN